MEALAAAVIELRLEDMEVMVDDLEVAVDETDVWVEELLKPRTAKLEVKKRREKARNS